MNERRPAVRRLQRRQRIGFLLLLIVLTVLIGLLPRKPAALTDSQQIHQVERVIDGDTLLLVGGSRVRLLGIDTPELGRDGQLPEPWSEPARAFLQSSIQDGRVSLGFDRESHDRYGRRLAYVYKEGRLLNEAVIRAGYSRAETGFPYHESMKLRFRQAEREAREQRRGLWSDEGAPSDSTGNGGT